jgi:DNA-binding transcriptional LysR family regulator
VSDDETPDPELSATQSDLDLNLLRTFLAVYRAGSFTAAAAQLGLSQPTVTTQMRSLERQADRRLFRRLPRGVEPTSFAHELAAQVSGPLDALSAVETSAGRLSPRSAPVHLGGPSELLCTRVLPALAGLVAGGVRLRVTQGLTDPLIDELRSGQQDVIIATRRPRGRALGAVALAEEEYVAIAAPAWVARLEERPGGSPPCSALRSVPLISYAEDMPIVRRYWRAVHGKPHPPAAPALTVPNLHAVVAAVAAGSGYSVVPRSICQEHIRDGRVRLIEMPEEPLMNTLYLVRRPGAEANPDVMRVCAALQAASSTW